MQATPANYDRAAEDMCNSVMLEHVNLRVPDQQAATIFYMMGLGLTREPYLMAGVDNMWVNVGRNQFHLGPHGAPQVLRGHTGLVVPDRAGLVGRLAGIRNRLASTRFEFTEHEDHVEVVCPWGNRFRCHAPDAARFGRILLGIPYIEFAVPPGTTEGIARFYRQALQVDAVAERDERGAWARARIGHEQSLHFREVDRPLPDYDGHHIQIYLHDFSGPYRWLSEHGLVSEESSRWQYRFTDIVDTTDERVLFVVEHEVRSMTHPLYGRALVNRNPVQTNRRYAPGHDAVQWCMGLDSDS